MTNKHRQPYELTRVRAGVYRVGHTHAILWQAEDHSWWWFAREHGASGKGDTLKRAHQAIIDAATTNNKCHRDSVVETRQSLLNDIANDIATLREGELKKLLTSLSMLPNGSREGRLIGRIAAFWKATNND